MLLLEFVPWMSPAPVQHALWALEEKSLPMERGKAHASCCRVSFRVAGRAWALLCSAGAGGCVVPVERREQRRLCVRAGVFLEIMQNFLSLSALEYFLGTEIVQLLSPGQ